MPIAVLPHAICCLAICHLLSRLMPFAIEPSASHHALAMPCCFALSLNSNANVTSCARWQMPRTRLKPHLGASVPAPRPHPGQSLRGGSVARAPPPGATSLHLTAERDARRTTVDESKMRFFSPAQAHVVESVLSASVATITRSQSATMPSNGTVHQVLLEKTNKGGWSQQTASRSALTGRSQEVAGPQIIQTDTCAQVADQPTMVLRDVLEQRRREPLTPYNKGAWAEWLSSFGLQEKYPHLVQGFARGFDLGIPTISCTYIPPNHNSVDSLNNVYSAIIENEFAAGRYVGPFSRGQLEQVLGPSKPPHYPWLQSHRSRASTAQFITSPTHTSHPQKPNRLTHTSTATVSLAHGGPSRRWPSSSHTCPLVHKRLYGTWQRHTG